MSIFIKSLTSEEIGSNEIVRIVLAEHESVPDEPSHDDRDGCVTEDFDHDALHVLEADTASFQVGKSQLHEKDLSPNNNNG